MTLIDENIDLLALVAEDYRGYAERNGTFEGFAADVGIGGGPFFGGHIDTYSRGGRITVKDEDWSVIAEYTLKEVYGYLTTQRLPLA